MYATTSSFTHLYLYTSHYTCLYAPLSLPLSLSRVILFRSKCNVFSFTFPFACIYCNLYHSYDSFSMFVRLWVCAAHRILVAFYRSTQTHVSYANVVVIPSHDKQNLPGRCAVTTRTSTSLQEFCVFHSGCAMLLLPLNSSCCRSLFGPSPRCFSLMLFFFVVVVFFLFSLLGASTCFLPFSHTHREVLFKNESVLFRIQYL